MVNRPPALSPDLLAALDQEIERRAAQRADALCAQRVAAGLYVEVLSPKELALAAEYGLRPVGGSR